MTTELGHELPTRAAEYTTDDGTKAITMSSLDRVYTTVPPPVLAEAATTVEVGNIRDALHDQDRAPLSDHVYVRTTIRLRPTLPPNVRPIPQWIMRHPLYACDGVGSTFYHWSRFTHTTLCDVRSRPYAAQRRRHGTGASGAAQQHRASTHS